MMANFKGIHIGPSDIRRVSGGQRRGGSGRQGWGIETVSMGKTLSIPEARRRLRKAADNVRDTTQGVLLGAGHVLKDAWKEEIDIEGYGPSGQGFGLGGLQSAEEGKDEANVDIGKDASKSTGRYYHSIEAEVDQDLEIHVGSTIPRPSGRGLREVSYPELLEDGFGTFEGLHIVQHAIDEAGPDMEHATRTIFNWAMKKTLMDGM